jgi:Tol biopolymer transport system component
LQRRWPNTVFSTAWNHDANKDVLYICVGPAFSADSRLEIHAIFNASGDKPEYRKLTNGGFNNAFPSSNPSGTQIVFRSTRDAPPPPQGGFRQKNLYIMNDAMAGESAGVTRLTKGDWTDTHCQWSPSGDWIVFSSSRGERPAGAPKSDNFLDPGYFGVYLVNPASPKAVVRVMTSAPPRPPPVPGGTLEAVPGHVNHPMFSPDGKSIVVTADLAAVSVEPISMPMFLHSVRPYGDIFSFDIDPVDIHKNEDIQKFHRVTHSRYEYATPVWTQFAIDDPSAPWKMLVAPDSGAHSYKPAACPYMHSDGGQSWHVTGHLVIPQRHC